VSQAPGSGSGGARPTEHLVTVSERVGAVPALLQRPERAQAMLALAHGAGAGMRHPFLATLADGLAARGLATLRYEFPYMAEGRGRPDFAPVLHATVRAAVAEARALAPDLPLLAGGKSMGGRMTGNAQADAPLEGVRGLVFVGYPLHTAGKPDSERAAALSRVAVPMLFLQGTRDALATLTLIEAVCDELGETARLHVVDGADHGFGVRKRDGRTAAEVMDELCAAIAAFAASLGATP
jgi:predicted alpha/beta-hydrolase family hydrolase